MKTRILFLIMLFPVFLFAQRQPTDAILFPVTSQSNLNTYLSFFDVQFVSTTSFWLARTKEVVELYNDAYGSLIIERRRNSDFTVIDSLEITGKATIGNIESDSDGNIYVIGRYRDSIKFGVNNVFYTTANYTGFAMKIDSNMQIQWINPMIDAFFITVSPDGNKVFARGNWNGMAGDVNIYQLNSSGNIIQTKLLNGIGYLSNIKTNNVGEIFFGGGCVADSTQLDTIMINSAFSYSMYYGKLDSNMQAEWVKLMDDFTCEEITIRMDTLGNVYFFGALNKSIVLDTFQASPNLSKDFLLASLGSSGTVNFIKSAPANYRIAPSFNNGMSSYQDKLAIFLDQDPNYNVHWGNNIYSQTGMRSEQLIVEINIHTGSVEYASIFQTAETEWIRDLLYLPNGDIITTGKMHGTQLVTSTDTLIGSSSHFYIERWELPNVTSLNEIQKDQLLFYPNPSEGIFNFSESISGNIYDIVGKIVLSFEDEVSINMSGFKDGVYILKTENGSSYKLIKY